jgi:hypothetical protein
MLTQRICQCKHRYNQNHNLVVIFLAHYFQLALSPISEDYHRREASNLKLVISELNALSRYVSREFHFIIKALIENYGWRLVDMARLSGNSKPLKSILLESVGELPEDILFWEGYDFLPERAKDILGLDCRKYIFADDLHCRDGQARYRKFISYLLCDAVLSTYAYVFDQFFPEISAKREVVWVPHSASPDFLIRFNPDAENKIFLSGAINHYYPLRQQMKALYDKQAYPIFYHPHPGYHCDYNYDKNENVGRGLAKKINSHRAAFTDCLKFNYIVAKYFEIPATGSLLLADSSVSTAFEQLGFVENVHYLPVSSDSLEDVIRYTLDESNHTRLDRIRKKGQALVRQKHKTEDRARLIDEVCRGKA